MIMACHGGVCGLYRIRTSDLPDADRDALNRLKTEMVCIRGMVGCTGFEPVTSCV